MQITLDRHQPNKNTIRTEQKNLAYVQDNANLQNLFMATMYRLKTIMHEMHF